MLPHDVFINDVLTCTDVFIALMATTWVWQAIAKQEKTGQVEHAHGQKKYLPLGASPSIGIAVWYHRFHLMTAKLIAQGRQQPVRE
jgi:hypothetical protein